MLTIHHAILHILDFPTDTQVFSEQELDVKEHSVCLFLEKHLERALKDTTLKRGTFQRESTFKEQFLRYSEGSQSFLDFSLFLAQDLHTVVSRTDRLEAMDIVLVDFEWEETPYFALLEFAHKTGYTHQVENKGEGIKNRLILHRALLPSLSQCVFICKKTLGLLFQAKKALLDGESVYVLPETLLQCDSFMSQKEAIKQIGTIAQQVAEKHGENSMEVIAKIKTHLAEETKAIEPRSLGSTAFSTSSLMKKEFEEEVETAQIPAIQISDPKWAAKLGGNHKIKTDTGIEISFPIGYMENKEFIEFINNPDGTLSISLRNIGKIIHR